MHTDPLDATVTAETTDREQEHARSQDDPWFRAHTRVSQTLPRLREIATQVAVVGIVIAPITPITDAWGVRGC